MESTPPSKPELQDRRRALGQTLRDARVAAGTSIPALAQSTRITLAFIEALEEGAFERLPGEVFGRGFVRSMAKTLGLDDAELVQAYDACWDRGGVQKPCLEVEIKEKPFGPGRVAETFGAVRRRMRPGRSFALFVATAVAVIAVVAVGQRLYVSAPWKGLGKKESPAAAVETAAAPAAPAAAAEPAPEAVPQAAAPAAAPAEPAAAEPAAGPAEIVLAGNGAQQVLDFVVTERVRIRATVDGAEPSFRELTPGTHQLTFNDKVELMIYDAAAVKISFNGRSLGSLGTKGRVRRLSFQAGSPDAKNL